MPKLKVKTEKELLVELRNKIHSDILYARASLIYWKRVASNVSPEDPKFLEAVGKMKINEDNIPKDTEFLQCIDDMLIDKIK